MALLGAVPMPVAFNGATRAKLLDAIERQLAHYTFQEKVEAIRADFNAHRSEFDAIEQPQAFASAVSDELYKASHDKHLRVFYSEDGLPTSNRPTQAELAEMRRSIAYSYAGYHVVAHLTGNIGYIRLDGFAPMPDAKTAIDTTMQSLALTDALIIDVRSNHGGDPDSLDYLLGYFFAKPVQLTSIYYHAPGIRDQVVRQFSAARVSGQRYLNKPIYVLTSAKTGSCAEQFAYDMKTLHRALLVGQATAGAANPGESFPLDKHFALFVPQGRAVNPYTRANWEGVGVAPDIVVESTGALLEAYTRALHDATGDFAANQEARRDARRDPNSALQNSLPATKGLRRVTDRAN